MRKNNDIYIKLKATVKSKSHHDAEVDDGETVHAHFEQRQESEHLWRATREGTMYRRY